MISQREIPCLHVPMYYSLSSFITHVKITVNALFTECTTATSTVSELRSIFEFLKIGWIRYGSFFLQYINFINA